MYKHIMVPLDGSQLAECVLPHVIALVTGCAIPRVTLVRVVTPLTVYGAELNGSLSPEVMTKVESESLAVARTYLDKKAEQLKNSGIQADANVMFGNVLEALTDYVERNAVDLIVIATHGRSGISRWVWGSVADRILRSAKVPVLMVRPQECPPPGV
jgi:nucleotide-binding universal stress UspA family protein